MKKNEKTAAWVFSGIGVAVITFIFNYFNPQQSTNSQNIEHFVAGDNMTIIQNINSKSNDDELSKPLEKTSDVFLGAIDRDYVNTKNKYITAKADDERKTISFLAGNCMFTTRMKQNSDSWDLYLTETDGVCKFLNKIKRGKPILRIIPEPGALANSGLVLRFVLQSGDYVLDDFFGTYEQCSFQSC